MSFDSLLNHRVNVQRQSPSRDTSGGTTQGYADVAALNDIPALVQASHGRASKFFGQRQVVVTHHVYLLPAHLNQVKRGDRLYWPLFGEYLAVHGLSDMGGQGEAGRLECTLET